MGWFDTAKGVNSLTSLTGLVVALVLFVPAVQAQQLTRLTHDGRLKFSPVFVDAEQLVYTDFVSPTLYRLQRLQLAEQSITPLHPGAKTSEFEAAFSRDGQYCAFIQTKGVLSLSVVIRNRVTNKETEVPPAPGFAGMRSPAISPDSRRVVYSFAEGGRQPLFSVSIDAGEKEMLTSEGMNNWPSFTPDGERIVFSSTRFGSFDVCSMASDGNDLRRLTRAPRQDIRPRVSPDGGRIVFSSTRDGNHELYLMNTDGSQLRRVTHHPERDDYPAWHPAGDRLVFVAERRGRHDLYLLELDDNGP